MSFKDYKNNEDGNPIIYSSEVDSYFKDSYGFDYDDGCFGFGRGLAKIFHLDSGDYLRVYLTKDIIYLYNEYDCGGKIWDNVVTLKDEDIYDVNDNVVKYKLEDFLDDLLDL